MSKLMKTKYVTYGIGIALAISFTAVIMVLRSSGNKEVQQVARNVTEEMNEEVASGVREETDGGVADEVSDSSSSLAQPPAKKIHPKDPERRRQSRANYEERKKIKILKKQSQVDNSHDEDFMEAPAKPKQQIETGKALSQKSKIKGTEHFMESPAKPKQQIETGKALSQKSKIKGTQMKTVASDSPAKKNVKQSQLVETLENEDYNPSLFGEPDEITVMDSNDPDLIIKQLIDGWTYLLETPDQFPDKNGVRKKPNFILGEWRKRDKLFDTTLIFDSWFNSLRIPLKDNYIVKHYKHVLRLQLEKNKDYFIKDPKTPYISFGKFKELKTTPTYPLNPRPFFYKISYFSTDKISGDLQGLSPLIDERSPLKDEKCEFITFDDAKPLASRHLPDFNRLTPPYNFTYKKTYCIFRDGGQTICCRWNGDRFVNAMHINSRMTVSTTYNYKEPDLIYELEPTIALISGQKYFYAHDNQQYIGEYTSLTTTGSFSFINVFMGVMHSNKLNRQIDFVNPFQFMFLLPPNRTRKGGTLKKSFRD